MLVKEKKNLEFNNLCQQTSFFLKYGNIRLNMVEIMQIIMQLKIINF